MSGAATAKTAPQMEFVKAVILGSGASTSTPQLQCLLSKEPCATCLRAAADPACRDNRCNPSCLLQLRHPADGSLHSVVIDVGKTFRAAALKSFRAHGVSDLSGVLITHGHADACMGLDDLRELARPDAAETGVSGTDVFADARTMRELHRQFSYLFPPDVDPEGFAALDSDAPIAGAGLGAAFRGKAGAVWTAAVRWRVMRPLRVSRLAIPARAAPYGTADFCFVAVPVLHGATYFCNAFVVQLDARRFLYYISDISDLTAEAEAQLAAARRDLAAASRRAASGAGAEEAEETEVAVLVVDMLSDGPSYPTHFGFKQSLAALARIGATQTYFVGMSHHAPHDELVKKLGLHGLADSVQPAYDGLVIAEGGAAGAAASSSPPSAV